MEGNKTSLTGSFSQRRKFVITCTVISGTENELSPAFLFGFDKKNTKEGSSELANSPVSDWMTRPLF
jgi:hypothetical protein